MKNGLRNDLFHVRRYKVGIIGATGMVGQRIIERLCYHPLIDTAVLAASAKSAGKMYGELMKDKWKLKSSIPQLVSSMVVVDASKIEEIADRVDFVFCAVDMEKKQ